MPPFAIIPTPRGAVTLSVAEKLFFLFIKVVQGSIALTTNISMLQTGRCDKAACLGVLVQKNQMFIKQAPLPRNLARHSAASPIALIVALIVAISGACSPVAPGTNAGEGDAVGDGLGGDGAADATKVPYQFPACSPVNGDPTLLRLRGAVWTGEVLLDDAEVFTSAATGKILCVGPDCSATPGADKATVVCVQGVIAPGLINPHDHGNYNHLPRWKHSKHYKDRYEWQADKSYQIFKAPQSATFSKAKCETMKWAELRALVGGTTSMQGTSGSACISGWVRDLDTNGSTGGLSGYNIDTQVTKISGTSDKTAQGWANGLKTGSSAALVVHLGEGIDALSRDEWYDLVAKGIALPGVSLIHATGLTGLELAEARQAGIKIIWSPQSNLDLYGDTTRVPAALKMGIQVALGPDWTPSGSMNMLDEMRCAKQLSDKRWGGLLTDEQLVKMATVDAAASVGADKLIGKLATGFYADIAVFRGDPTNAFASILAARPETIKLVLIGGKPQYGDAEIMGAIAAKICETMDVCGMPKMVCMRDAGLILGDESVAQIKSSLEGVLKDALAADKPSADYAYAYELWPLFECGAKADALIHCDVSGGTAVEPSATDADGDGKADASDNCPKIWNPDQGNLDGDAQGDACDVCPFVVDATTCPKPGPDDVDGDGVANAADNCPNLPNSDQKDGDGDAKGDKCDPCPTAANPGSAECPSLTAEVPAINQGTGNYAQGDLLHVAGLVVTAYLASTSKAPAQVWAQTNPPVPYGGMIFQLPKGSTAKFKAGQVIAVTGKYAAVFGLKQLTEAVITPGDLSQDPSALTVSVETLAEAPGATPYLSMLVQVLDAKVEASNADAASSNDYGELLLVGGLRVDDLLIKWGAATPRPADGAVFKALRGISTLSYGQYKILPRSAADFVK